MDAKAMVHTVRNLFARARRRPLVASGMALLAGILMALAGWHARGWYHLWAAERCLHNRDFVAAQDHLAICRDVWPGSPTTLFLAARTARRAGRPADAYKLLDDCRQLGGPAEAIVLETYLLRLDQAPLEDLEKKLFVFIHKGHADSWLILEALSGECMKSYRMRQTLAYLDLWRKLQPADREPVIREGWVLEHLERLEEAIVAYQQALDLEPERDQQGDDRVRLRLGELLVKKNRSLDALGHFEALHARQPHNPAVLLGLARCRQRQGQSDKALALLAELSAGNPHDGQALGERGRIELESGRPARAEPWLRQAASLCPHEHSIIHNMQRCLERLDKKAEAKTWSARLDRLRADEGRMRNLMQEVMASPDDPDLRYQIGMIFLRNGLAEDGCRWLDMTLQADPQHRSAHQALAEHYDKLGQAGRAAPHRQALAALPDNGKKASTP